METIGSRQIYSFVDRGNSIVRVSNSKIRLDQGFSVGSYLDLAKRVAELQFRNPDYVLMFRGQKSDHQEPKTGSSLRPSILRGGHSRADQSLVRHRFEVLRTAEALLLDRFPKETFGGFDKLKRQQLLRWSILQHYEVCKTPLLDVTQSLRIGASFASNGTTNEAFLFVLGMPNVSGAITASAEAGLEIIRLASVCPPEAVRPHIQEGYLLSEFPELRSYEQKQQYESHEIDFGLRLVAKFRFDPQRLWGNSNFPQVPNNALYPRSKDDPFYDIAEGIKNDLPPSQ